MNYIGMTALHFSDHVMWDRLWLLYSFLIAVIASGAAMEMLERSGTGMKNLSPRLIASVGIAIAVCGMHYAGVGAFIPENGSVNVHLAASCVDSVLSRVVVR